jgi:hypothetical protein
VTSCTMSHEKIADDFEGALSMRIVRSILVFGSIVVVAVSAVSCKKSEANLGTDQGAGTLNACSLITKEDAELMMGPGAKKVFHSGWNECYVIQATTPDADTNRPSPEHAYIALRVFTRARWEKEKRANATDRAIDGIGDEAIDQVSAIAFRKGDNCLMLSGWRSYLDSAEHPIAELPNRILGRL